MRRPELAVEYLSRLRRGHTQISVQSHKIAGHVLLIDDGLDTIDRGRVTCSGEPRPRLAEEPLKFVVTVVERVREMRGGVPGLHPSQLKQSRVLCVILGNLNRGGPDGAQT